MRKMSDRVMLILAQLWQVEGWYLDELKTGIGFLPDNIREKWHKEIMKVIHGETRS